MPITTRKKTKDLEMMENHRWPPAGIKFGWKHDPETNFVPPKNLSNIIKTDKPSATIKYTIGLELVKKFTIYILTIHVLKNVKKKLAFAV